MDSFELNKMIGAVLFCLLIIMGVNQFGNILVSPKKLAEPAYKIEVAEEAPKGGAGAAAKQEEADPPIATLLASANVDAGKKAFSKCAACHTPDKGGAAKVGPNLYDIVGAPKGHMSGFSYSDGLMKTGGEWSYESLYAFLKNPKAYAPGTKMAYAGSKSAKERADLIAYLRSLSDSPKPLP
ncbi:MAG: c-type cytochrome [Ferrovibrio sp.]|uniref:c-type cytochrome n=1 Tax=Ferrovibrio sp. TaxID=1917215 RepID=UPI00391BC3E6